MLTNIESLRSVGEIKEDNLHFQRKEKKLTKQAINKALNDFNEKSKNSTTILSNNQPKSENKSKIVNN